MSEKSDIKELCKTLAARGIVSVEIEYAGSGDSGEVNQVTAYNDSKAELPLFEPERSSLEDWAYEKLESSAPGWEINSGSYGTITLDTVNAKATINHHSIVEVTEDSTFNPEV